LPDAVARLLPPGVNWAGRSVYGIPVFGFLLLALSHGAYSLHDGWVMAGLIILVGVVLIAEGQLWPAERRLQVTVAPLRPGRCPHGGRNSPGHQGDGGVGFVGARPHRARLGPSWWRSRERVGVARLAREAGPRRRFDQGARASSTTSGVHQTSGSPSSERLPVHIGWLLRRTYGTMAGALIEAGDGDPASLASRATPTRAHGCAT